MAGHAVGGGRPQMNPSESASYVEAQRSDEDRKPLLAKGLETWEGSGFVWSFSVLGPGLLVCLADTDAGCLLVAGQSGSRWGYALLPLQVFLIPVLFMAQDLTVRLGVCTQQGHSACIRDNFGRGWCWFTTALLILECIIAMVSEMSGVAAVGRLWGLSNAVAVMLAAVVILAAVVGLRYRQIEALGIAFGLCELVFVFTMFWYHPAPAEVFKGSFTGTADPEYLKLISANIGAVIMPWMIYFQQSAVVARRMTTGRELSEERTGTLIGSFLTQLIMIGALVTLAAAHSVSRDLRSTQDIVSALSPAFGPFVSKLLISFAFLGGSLCASFVVALAGTWALCEALSLEDTFALEQTPTEAPFFYGSFACVVLFGVVVLLSGINVVKLNVMVELLDGILMPVAVGFLYLLATSKTLPEQIRVKGLYKWVLGIVFAAVACVSLVSAFASYLTDSDDGKTL